jgi:hypothetical protein
MMNANPGDQVLEAMKRRRNLAQQLLMQLMGGQSQAGIAGGFRSAAAPMPQLSLRAGLGGFMSEQASQGQANVPELLPNLPVQARLSGGYSPNSNADLMALMNGAGSGAGPAQSAPIRFLYR